MVSNKLNFTLTLIISIGLFFYLKSREPRGKGSLDNQASTTEQSNKLPIEHPLNHVELEIIDSPLGNWADGFIYIHDVMDFLFASEDERKLAQATLLKFGYGEGKTDYLYFKDSKATLNGTVFNTINEAKDFLSKSTIKKLRVFILKKEDFPSEIKVDNIEFYMIPWDKRALPEIKL